MQKQIALHKRTDEQLEDHLDKIEADPAFQGMMRDSALAIREGRITPHEQVMRMSRALGKRKPKRWP